MTSLNQLVARLRASKLLSHLLVAIAAIGLTITVYPDHTVVVHTGLPPASTRSSTLQKPTQLPAPTKAAAVRYADALAGGELAQDLRGHDPAPQGSHVRLASAAGVHTTDSIRTTLRLHSPNYSTRTGRIEQIVLHSTESPCTPGHTTDLLGVGHFLSEPVVQASIEIINNCDGKDLRLVPDFLKAWHVVAYNSASVGIEQIGHAAQLHWPAKQLHNTALWIVRWHRAYPWIPIAPSHVSNGTVTKPGVTMHMRLGLAGGGHHDPGAAYPFARVLAMARAIAAPAVKPISAHTTVVCRKYAWFGPVGSKLAASRGPLARARHGERRRYLLRNRIACSTAGVATRR